MWLCNGSIRLEGFNYLQKMLRLYADPGIKDLWDRNETLTDSHIARLSKAEYYWKDSFRIMKQTRLSFLNDYAISFGRSTGSITVRASDDFEAGDIPVNDLDVCLQGSMCH